MSHPGKKTIQAKKHLAPRCPHRQSVRQPQRGPQLVKAGRNTVGQKGIGQPRTGQKGIIRGKILLVRQGSDKTQVHTHIAIGSLAGINHTILPAERVPNQIAEENPYRQNHPQKLPPMESGTNSRKRNPRHGKAAAPPQSGASQKYIQTQAASQSERGKIQEESEEHGKPLKRNAAPHAADQQTHSTALFGKSQPCKSHTAALEQSKNHNRQRPALQCTLHHHFPFLIRIRGLYHFPEKM